jgi:lysyl-tRNA synthetase class 2
MITTIAERHFGGLTIEHKNADGTVRKTINLQRPWRRVRMADLVEERTGWKFDKQKLQDSPVAESVIEAVIEKAAAGRAERSPHANLQVRRKLSEATPAEQLVEVYEKLIEPTLVDPTYVTHVPSVIIPLARKNRDDDFFADVYELAINGQEISPGYSELNDPEVQAANFTQQVGEDQQKVDEDFLAALRYGMPPAGGMGLGIDRLVMMLTGAESIRDVILFPLMKPQDKDAKLAEEPANPT